MEWRCWAKRGVIQRWGEGRAVGSVQRGERERER
jgi:hypothetical protein